jgi:hypothetical protein
VNATNVYAILESDILIYTASIHWNVVRSHVNGVQPKVIYVDEYINEITNRIINSFDPSILTKKSVLHLAHWYSEHMIREQYAQLVNKQDK